jgi:hypothetical protein
VPDSFEIFVNEQRADLAAYRIILTVFLLRLVGADPPTAESKVQELKTTVLNAVGRIQTDPSVAGDERMKQMTAMRAEKFFVELEEVVSETLNKMGLKADKN